jgi:hypothetical protein
MFPRPPDWVEVLITYNLYVIGCSHNWENGITTVFVEGKANHCIYCNEFTIMGSKQQFLEHTEAYTAVIWVLSVYQQIPIIVTL